MRFLKASGESGASPPRLERRSEEVADIITSVPHWIVRGGTGLLLLFVCAGLLVSWLIRYPDVVRAPLVLTTDPAPAKLTARVPGRLVVVRREGEVVEPGALLAYVETPVRPDEVMRLEERLRAVAAADPRQPAALAALREVSTTPHTFGPLQGDFEAFARAVGELESFVAVPSLQRQVAGLRAQIAEGGRLRTALERQRAYTRQEVALAEQALQTAATLNARQMLPAQELAAAESRVLQQRRDLEAVEVSLINNDLQVRTLQQRALELEMAHDHQQRTLLLALANARKELLTRIELWKESHLFFAPRAGRVTYHRYEHQSPFAAPGAVVLSVVPEGGRVRGQIELPVASSRHVKVGQPVRTDLDSYPAAEFGYLEGRVSAVSPLPIEGTYRIDVELTNGLTTSYHRPVEFRHEMTGSSRIVTEDLRLLERVFYQFRRLWS